MGKKIGIGIGAFLGVVIIAVVVIFVIATRPAELPPARTPPPASPGSAPGTPLPALQDQLKSTQDAVKQAQTTGQDVPVTVTITEAAANEELVKQIAAAPKNTNLVIHGGRLYFDQGRVNVTVAVDYQGFSLTLTVVTTAAIVDGQPKLTTESIDVGGISLPDAVKAQISGMVNNEINRIVKTFIAGSKGVTFTKVEIGYMYLELTGIAPAKT